SINVTDAYMDYDKVWAVFDGDVLNRTALEHQGDGVYTYSFDTTNMDDGDTEITIMTIDLVGHEAEAGPLLLQVDNNPPDSWITTEGGNVTGTITIMATVNDPYLNATEVYLVIDGDDDNSTMMDPVDGEGTYQLVLDTRDVMDGTREFTVYAEDMWGQWSRSPAVYFDVDNYAPMIKFVSGGGERWGNYQVRANITEANLNKSCVMVKIGTGDPVKMREAEEYWYYNVDTRDYPDGPLTFTVTACDLKGNENPGETWTITVSNRADLEITKVEWVSNELELGDKAKVKVTVRNNGHTTVKGFIVRATSGTKELATITESTGVQPGKSHSYTLVWEPKSTGDQVVRLDVDPEDTVDETDETNNHYEQQTITVSEASSSVPGMGAVLAVAAVIAVSLALLDRRKR
ncbi:MAG: hypothetical protein JSW25_04265, partial [Thermoplasmata archaeon]